MKLLYKSYKKKSKTKSHKKSYKTKSYKKLEVDDNKLLEKFDKSFKPYFESEIKLIEGEPKIQNI